ncbi:hypothetical protein LCL89_10615 [Halobacillus yeomjeoni]|nr:hypothetical protein [Halobacillus yeomjeoni]MCA0984495.1 hypothetical protein [Halobacillus yeomjeoni]
MKRLLNSLLLGIGGPIRYLLRAWDGRENSPLVVGVPTSVTAITTLAL